MDRRTIRRGVIFGALLFFVPRVAGHVPVHPGSNDAPRSAFHHDFGPGARNTVPGSAGHTRPSVATASPARRPLAAPEPWPTEIAESEILVEARNDTEAPRLEQRLWRELSARTVRRIGHDPAFWVRLPEGTTVRTALNVVRSWTEVASATPNAITRGTSDRATTAPPGRPWNLTAARIPERSVSPSVTIAVLDSGLAYRNYIDAQGRRHTPAPWLTDVRLHIGPDLVHGDAHPDDENNHGTHIASMLVGPFGMARGATLMPVQVLDENLVGTEAALVGGIDWAVAHGAKVINLSLAFGAGYYPSRLLDRAIARALQAGVVLVAAAGNVPRDEVRFPAAFPGVIAVGASTLVNRSPGFTTRTRYSSYGAELDFLAPGGDLDRDADHNGMPDGILGFTFDPREPSRFGPWLFAGTSQSVAHATAAAAHLLSAGAEPPTIAARLRTAARPIEARRFDPTQGAGTLDVFHALHTEDQTLPNSLAVQLTATLEGTARTRTVTARVAVLNTDGERQPNVTVYARWRGAVSGTDACTTGRDGICAFERSFPRSEITVAALEVSALVDRTGRAVRPSEAFLRNEEVNPVIHTLEHNEPGVPVWRYSSTDGTVTYLLRGLAVDTALPPTVVVLDEAAFARLTHSDAPPSGTGFGSSSYVYYVFTYNPSWFALDPASFGGTGFGSSSYDLYLFSSWTYWSWGLWGPDAFLRGAQFAPGEALACTSATRAASVHALSGAGYGIPAR